MDNNIILIFTKIPYPGLVKTRLTLDTCLSDNDAAFISEAMLKDTLVLSSKTNAIRIDLGYTPVKDYSLLKKIVETIRNDGLLTKPIKYHIQDGSNFDERFESVVCKSFNAGADNLVILGADLPFLDYKIINKAFELLSNEENELKMVLGSSSGGGIYLVGINKSFDYKWFTNYKLFRSGVEISQFTNLCENKGILLNLLPAYGDIDLEEDLISLIAYIEALSISEYYEGFHFPEYTAKVLKNLNLYIGEVEGKTRNRKLMKK